MVVTFIIGNTGKEAWKLGRHRELDFSFKYVEFRVPVKIIRKCALG